MKRFRVYYSSGPTVDVKAKECTVTKAGALISNVRFEGVRGWLSFTAEGVVAVKQLGRFER